MKIPALILILANAGVASEWTPLLDPSLSKWEIFIGIPHLSVEYPGLPSSGSENCIQGTPAGSDGDPLKIFTMIEEDGQPVLHISGQVYAGLSTREEFENYHLSWEFKWGEKKWPPRLDSKRDSGILSHCVGEQGAFWNVWMRSLECQIQEGDCGDFIPLAGAAADIRLRIEEANPRPIYDPAAPLYTNTNYTRRSENHEKPNGEWNTMEIYTLGQTMVFAVNGEVNMVLFNTRQSNPDGPGQIPLTKGKLQIQSEAAEVFFRDVKIKPISAFPDKLAVLTVIPEGKPIRFEPRRDKTPDQ